MKFVETRVNGAYVLDLERHEDERGFFARAFCRKEFAAIGADVVIAQVNVASNRRKGTVRGMHFQYPPAQESKLVRCTRGVMLDVIVDLRPESATFLEHVAVELSEDNRRALFVPERCAHGYQTLCDATDMLYATSEFYTPAAEGGLAYDDPRLAIAWPLPISLVSERDRGWPTVADIDSELRRRMGVVPSASTLR
jgi:dTDP-4-dehydrorhamnose 3,5-epimerase